ncbi:magnesium transporter CorA family protein [Roseibium polysiphoniae]|uniref:Magnesium transporter CorA family protein n=1 Tax=Roseibium polysiphoniae TaxID=2571221 RepID=A0ABR9CD87_9HYPH|nr:magnesium transporter CorA family protein [Roseibium polysiphoniae]MBD8877870.1 magnesium transporter CorA family protein [Roseibium polysiphoniae]
MIISYCPSSAGLERREVAAGEPLPSTSVWIDMVQPTHEEQLAAEKLMGAEIPTREEIASIETSARLYDEPGAIVMTGLLPMAARTPDPELSSVTFVLSSKRLVTVRYGDPQSIVICGRKVQKDATIPHTGPAVFFTLMEIIIDRSADVMEEASRHFDEMSFRVFEEGITARKGSVYQEAIKTQGRIGLQVAKMHDVCASLSRLLLFLDSHGRKVSLSDEQYLTCKSFGRDIHSIKEHGDALDNKLSFLLDATIGLVNLEQNQIIKVFSVLGVIFLPPTLIASIYGMNFINMPELKWHLGFVFSIALMFASVAMTYFFLRWKKLL